MMNRREVLNLAVAAGTSAAFVTNGAVPAEETESPQFDVTDTNVSLFRWPFRRLPLDDVGKLTEKLSNLGITQAWTGTFEGLFHRDIAAVNQRLINACKSQPLLVPIGSINPTLPGWETDIQQCAVEHNMPGIRLHPNYHGYALNDPRFTKLLQRAKAANLLVQIAVSMEDTRTQQSSMRVSDVDVAPLAKQLPKTPGVRIQLLNHRLRPPQLQQLSQYSGVFFDTARVDGTDSIPKLVECTPPCRVLFGSHAPFLIPESALIRVHESGMLDEAELRAVLSGHAMNAIRKTPA